MGRLIIHIGTHKTGTTSIQRTLGANRKKLRERGIRYPDYTMVGQVSHYAHIGAANAFAGEAQRMTTETAREFFSMVGKTLDRAEVTLLSAESLFRHHVRPSSGGRLSPEDYWTARSEFIARFRELVGPAEIAIVLRRQCDFAESMYQEHVKVTKYGRSFKTFLDDFWYHFDYYSQIHAWKAHFENVSVLKFDDIKGPAITRRFLLKLGLKPGRFPEAEMTNVGIAPDLVLVKRFLNGGALSKDQLKKVLEIVSASPMASKLPGGKRHMFANVAARRSFQAQFETGNEKIVSEFFGGAGELFTPLVRGRDGARFGDELDMKLCQAAVGDLVLHLLEKQRPAPKPRAKVQESSPEDDEDGDGAGDGIEPTVGLETTQDESPSRKTKKSQNEVLSTSEPS